VYAAAGDPAEAVQSQPRAVFLLLSVDALEGSGSSSGPDTQAPKLASAIAAGQASLGPSQSVAALLLTLLHPARHSLLLPCSGRAAEEGTTAASST
jgi:hypothetical protein